MNKLTVFLIAVIMTFSTAPAKAQTLELTEEAKIAFEAKINQMVDAFLKNLSIIGSKNVNITDKVKDSYINTTLKMFMGGEKGVEGYYTKQNDKKYEYYKDLISGEECVAPYMQVTSLKNSEPRDVPIRKYLINMKGIGYDKVIIKQAKTCYISELSKIGENKYEATATYYQYFRGERGDGRIYQDYTEKTIKIVVYVEEVLGKQMFVVRFSNILANDTTPVK